MRPPALQQSRCLQCGVEPLGDHPQVTRNGAEPSITLPDMGNWSPLFCSGTSSSIYFIPTPVLNIDFRLGLPQPSLPFGTGAVEFAPFMSRAELINAAFINEGLGLSPKRVEYHHGEQGGTPVIWAAKLMSRAPRERINISFKVIGSASAVTAVPGPRLRFLYGRRRLGRG